MRTSQFILLFLCSLIGFSGTVHAQDSLKLVPTISVDSLDLLALQMEDDLRDQQGLAPRYAVPNLVEITAATHGHWEKLDDKLAMWRLRFTCKNAISMNFGFQRWLLPIDSEMMIYNVEGTHRIRPFTIDDYNDSGELWTPAVAGGDVIIEIRCPQNAVTLIKEEIKLTSVNAGYRGFHEAFGQQPLPNNTPSLSGSCNIDVACPESVGWENEIDCVGVISTGGSTFCTGFMVNNTSQDGTPYFMTADHCGIVSGNAPSLVVYWNYENSFCRPPGSAASGGPGDGVLNQFSTGSIYRAGSATSDFTLVELNSPPNAAFGVSFCGWDASTSAPTSAVGIHHPATDEKRISFENQPPSLSTNFVTVNDWDAGTTEPGSSGSPLFDQNHRVIGQLCCGGAACGNNLSDDYGRFSRSWNLGLAAWLDSAGTGQLFVDTLPAGGGGPVEQCSNGTDDDGDGLVDCNDPDCAPSPACGGGGGPGAPANDLCSDAQAVGEGVFAFDNTGSVLDGPVDCDANMDTDVWFAYSPSASGTALIETCGTAGTLDDTVLIVYDGGLCPPSPACLASDDDGCTAPNFSSTVAVPVTAGNTYLIQVGGWNGATGTSDLSISLGGGPLVEDCTNGVDDDGDGLADCADPDCATNPACGGGGGGNDECIGAIAMFDGPNFFDTTGLTNSADPVPTGCPNAFGGMNNDGWFTYTATSTGDAIFNTCDPAGFDTDLAIYAGDCSALALLGCDGDGSTLAGCQTYDSEVIVPVIAGETYVIRVGGFGATTAGLGTVTITVGAGPILEDCTNGVDDDGDGLADCADPDCATNPACGGGTGPANDLCIDAIPVAEGVFAYDNTGAFLDGPIDCDANMTTDVWFLYTASSTGTATIGTCDAGGSQDDTVLIVYDGSFCPTAGDPCIASADDTCANTAGGAAFMSQVDIPVTAGSSYLVQVGGWNGTEGNGDLTISLGTGPGPVENCTNGTDDDGDGLIDCADDDCIGDPACGGGGTGPANDDCANAQAVGEGVFAFDNTGAILDGPTDCETNMDTDVWFAYTPSASGTATIETCGTLGSMDDTVLIVYDGGTCPPSPACLASDDDGCTTPNFSSTVAVPVTAGNTYLIQVGGWNGATGNSDLSISLGGGPAPVENCTNGTDDDGDGFIDCEDTDCDQDPACTPPPVENCTNGTDDDGDGLADCADPDCSNDPSCITNGFSFIAQDASGTYSPDTGTGSFTGTVSASEDSAAPGYPNETQGFSFGLSHDATLLSANGFNTGAALNGLNSGSGPDFLDVNTYSDGVTVGCVYSFSSPGTVVLQLTSETVLGTIDYDTVPSGLIGNTAGTTTSLSWSNALGVPPVINIMVVGGQANPASLIDGTVTLDAAVGGFVRGDINDDASINIADAVSLLAGLFTGGAIPCSDSADANDDGATNIADAVYVLANLFSGGPGMPAPTGPSCGPDPTADGLDCANYNSCP